jgi:hypothetical protein
MQENNLFLKDDGRMWEEGCEIMTLSLREEFLMLFYIYIYV